MRRRVALWACAAAALVSAAGCDDAEVGDCTGGGSSVRDTTGSYCVYADDLPGGALDRCPATHPSPVQLSSGLVCADYAATPSDLPLEVCVLLRERCALPMTSQDGAVDAVGPETSTRDVGMPSSDMGIDMSASDRDAGSDLGPTDPDSGRDMGPIDMGPTDMGPIDMGPIDMGPTDMGPTDMGPADMGCTMCSGLCRPPVFFDSSPDHCGRCGHGCAGGACTGGRCQPVVVVATLAHPWVVEVDGTHVYFGDPRPTSGFVGRVSRTIPSTEDPVATDFGAGDFGVGLALSTGHVYWSDFTNGTVHRRSKGVGGAFMDTATGQCSPHGIAVDEAGGHVYWANRCTSSGVMRANLDLSSPMPISVIRQQPFDVAVESGDVFWTELGAGTGTSDGRVMMFSGSGATATLAMDRFEPRYIAVYGSHVYFTERSTTTRVMRVLRDGSGAPEAIAFSSADIDDPRGLFVDATGVYISDYGTGKILQIPHGGGTYVTLASGQSNPSGIAVADGVVYWANFVDGSTAMMSPIMSVVLP